MRKFVRRNGFSAIFYHDFHHVRLRLCIEADFRSGVTVVDCISNQVVKRARKLVRIAYKHNVRCNV